MIGYYRTSDGYTRHYLIEDIYYDGKIGMTIFAGKSPYGNIVRLSSREVFFKLRS